MDFSKEFTNAYMKGYVAVEWDSINVYLPIDTMYGKYQLNVYYDETLRTYIEISKKVLGQYIFMIDYDNVSPMLKGKEFGLRNNNLNLYKEVEFEDINTLMFMTWVKFFDL